MTPFGITILIGIAGYATYKVMQTINRKEKRKSELSKIEALFSENKILKQDYEKLKIKLSSSMLFDNKNFDNYNKSLADASDNFIRFNTLVKKYGNEIALNIMESKVWIGMTKAQILESKGKPHDSDKEEMKSKVRENYYYYSTADKKKYHTYTIENDELVKIVEK